MKKLFKLRKALISVFPYIIKENPISFKQYLRNIISEKINRNIHIAPQSIDYPDIGGSTETLLTNSPHPFNVSTVISYYGTNRLLRQLADTPWQANSHSSAQIQIYNIKGQIVIELGIENYKL